MRKVSVSVQEVGSGPQVVLLPPLGGDRRVWGAVAERLSGRARCRLVDLSTSEPLEPERCWAAMVEATVAAVAPDRWDSAVLGGVSLGGNLAVAVARQVGCRGLLVVSTTPLLGIPDALRARAEDVRRRGEVAHLAGGQIDRWLGPDSAHRTTQLAGELATMLSSVHPDHYANCCAIGAELDQTAELAALDVPTAWVAGTHDQATPLDRQAVAASLVPDAVFVPVVGHHMVPWTAPTAVAQAVADHLLYR